MARHARLVPIVGGALLLACSSDSKTPTQGEAAPEARKAEAGAQDGSSPLGDEPLANGQPSLEALGKGIVAALAAKDGGALMRLSVSQGEFERRLFGTLVTDPKARKWGPGPSWKNLSSESLVAMASAVSKHGGKGHAFVRLEPGRREELPGLVRHIAPKLVVKDAGGTELELPILGEVVEHPASGTFLVLSFAD